MEHYGRPLEKNDSFPRLAMARPQVFGITAWLLYYEQDVTQLGENRSAGSGPSFACGCTKIIETVVLADTGGR